MINGNRKHLNSIYSLIAKDPVVLRKYDMPLTLSKARVLTYNSTLHTSATTVTEMTATLNKEQQLVSEWVARNKLTLNIYKTKSIVFGTKHSLNPKPQLNLVINTVEIEQVEMSKLLVVTLD